MASDNGTPSACSTPVESQKLRTTSTDVYRSQKHTLFSVFGDDLGSYGATTPKLWVLGEATVYPSDLDCRGKTVGAHSPERVLQ